MAVNPSQKGTQTPIGGAIDMALCYGSTEFVESSQPREPWAKESFQIVVDAVVNHSHMVYARRRKQEPTRLSVPARLAHDRRGGFEPPASNYGLGTSCF